MSIKLTQQQIIAWGGQSVYDEAAALVKRGAVTRADVDGDCIEGEIMRPNGAIQSRVRIRANGTAESLCPCYISRQQGLICSHVVALAITVAQRRNDPLREQRYREEQRHARAVAAKLAAGEIVRSRQGTAARLRLFPDASWQQGFAANAIDLGCLFQVGAQLLPAAALTDPAGYALAPQDDALLAVLEDICEGTPPARFTVGRADFFNILELCRGAELPLTDNTDLTVCRETLPFTLRLDLDRETGELLIFPDAPIPGAQPGEFAAFLAHNNKSWACLNGRLWQLSPTLPLPYHSIYSEPIVIPRSDILRFRAHEVRQLREHGVPLATEFDLELFTVSPGSPVFHLAVRGSPASLALELRAVYGERAVIAAAPSADFSAIPDPDDLLHFTGRNPDAETRAVQRLNQMGFAGTSGGNLLPVASEREVLNFLGSGIPLLRRLGWKVEMQGRVAGYYDNLPMVTPVVRINAPDSNGWFEVEMSFDCHGGAAITSADVQRAINCGDSFISRNGQTILIDSTAIQSMRDAFSDCHATEGRRPGSFRLNPAHTPFIQASLAAIDGIDVEEPPDWRARAQQQNRDLRLAPVPLGDDTLETTLRDYQKQGVYWLRFLEGAGFCGLLADEMGLGKTLQTLAWLSLERSVTAARGKPALVVCPTSLVENWNREAERFVPRLKRLVLNGPNRQSLFTRIAGSDLVITSYALLRRDLEEGYAGQEFSVAVLDEAQHIKNRSTQNAIAAKQIRAAARLVLTGTPLENSVADLWSIMDFLMPGYLGDYETFRLNYELPIAAAGDSGEQAQLKLRRKLHPFMLRRLKRDVAKDLPDKITKVSYCTLTPDQQVVYNTLLNESRRKIGEIVREKGFNGSRMEILAMLLRLRQAACHLGLLPADTLSEKAAAPSAKLEHFFELLDEAIDGGHRILVFSQFVTMLQIIRDELDRRQLSYCYLDGSTKNRLEQVRRFNHNPGIPLFLISLKAGGTGLTLTGADMVVHFDPWWNPAVEDQATDRAHRIGQKRTVYSVKLIAEHTVEEKVLAMQQKKQAVINATIGTTDEAMLKTLSWDDVRSLLDM